MSRDIPCDIQASGDVELYFYGELDVETAAVIEEHVASCPDCGRLLEELRLIREALAGRPDVSAPPNGDWSAFMARLDGAVASEVVPLRPNVVGIASRRSYVPLLAMAALLTLVTMTVLFVARNRQEGLAPSQEIARGADASATSDTVGLATVGQQHLERSKLVLLGLTSKDAAAAGSEWEYERDLATRLLADTRLYRIAAEDRGMTTLAGILKDLELVLLQTSMTQGTDPAALSQIQRAIRKRDLLQKVDMIGTTGI